MDAESRTGFKALPSSTLPPPNARCTPSQVLLPTVASPASWLQAPRGGGWGPMHRKEDNSASNAAPHSPSASLSRQPAKGSQMPSVLIRTEFVQLSPQSHLTREKIPPKQRLWCPVLSRTKHKHGLHLPL